MKKSNTYSRESKNKFIDSIIEAVLNTKVENWDHFAKSFDLGFPVNPLSNPRTEYKGLNIFFLLLSMVKNGYSSPNFATYKQIEAIGGDLKGQKATPIQKYGFYFIHKENKNVKLEYKDYLLLSDEEKKNYYKSEFTKVIYLFNFDQINNVKELDLTKYNLAKSEDLKPSFETDEEIENFFSFLQKEKGLKINRQITKKAFYNLNTDSITIPKNEIFVSDVAYYSTTFHEIIHWTGHETRLNRLQKCKFASKEYSFEELVAEIGAMLLCFEFNLIDGFYNSIAYLQSWLKATNKEDKNECLNSAFIFSKQAVKFLK